MESECIGASQPKEKCPVHRDQVVELGDEVHSEISNIKGICVGISKELHGCDRITIQPQDPLSKEVINAWDVDDVRVQVLTKGKVAPKLEAQPKPSFKLGDEIVDDITGFKGIAVAFVTSINGCIYVKVHSKQKAEGKRSLVDYQHVYRYRKATAPKQKEFKPSKSGGLDSKAAVIR
jgi:hypothetical protein